MNRRIIPAAVLALALTALLGGCSSAPQAGRADAARVQAAGSGLLRFDPGLARAVSSEEGVLDAIILLDERHNAYGVVRTDPDLVRRYVKAPLDSDHRSGVRSVGELPSIVQARIASALRRADREVQAVLLTNDPHHFERIRRRVQEASTASLRDGGAMLAEEVRDIWR